jgi:hypothetical protein
LYLFFNNSVTVNEERHMAEDGHHYETQPEVSAVRPALILQRVALTSSSAITRITPRLDSLMREVNEIGQQAAAFRLDTRDLRSTGESGLNRFYLYCLARGAGFRHFSSDGSAVIQAITAGECPNYPFARALQA